MNGDSYKFVVTNEADPEAEISYAESLAGAELAVRTHLLEDEEKGVLQIRHVDKPDFVIETGRLDGRGGIAWRSTDVIRQYRKEVIAR